MAKKKPAPKPHEEPTHLEDTLTEVTDSVAKAFKKYQMPIVVGAVALIAILALSAVFGWYKDASAKNQAQDIYSVFAYSTEDERKDGDTRTDEEIEAAVHQEVTQAAAALAPRLEGAQQEPNFIARYAAYLWDMEDEHTPVRQANREKAVSLLKGALERHSDNAMLKKMTDNYAKIVQLDAGFVVPAPPEPEAPSTGIQVSPGATISPAPSQGNTITPPGQPEIKLTPVPAPTNLPDAAPDAATSQPNGGN